MGPRTSAIIAYVVTTCWALSFLADIFIAKYDPPQTLNTAMLMVVGAATSQATIAQFTAVRRTRSKDQLEQEG